MSRSPRTMLAVWLLVSICIVAAGTPVEGKKKKKGQTAEVPIVCYDVAVHGTMALLAQTSGLSLWDISNPVRPESKFRLPLPATILGIAESSPYVYLAAGSHGMYIARWDWETPPELVSRHDTPGSVIGIELTGHYALLADERYGLRVIDVSDPTQPLQKAQVSTRDRVYSIALKGNLLATAEGGTGVRLFDFERPERPVELFLLRDVADARDVAWAGDRLLVASRKEGLLVYELGRDRRPKLTGQAKVEGLARFVGGDGEWAVVSNGTPALQLVRIDDSGEPSFFDEIRVHRSAPAGRVHVEGTLAYAALDRAGIAIVDLADPLAPSILLPQERRMKIDWPGRETER